MTEPSAVQQPEPSSATPPSPTPSPPEATKPSRPTPTKKKRPSKKTSKPPTTQPTTQSTRPTTEETQPTPPSLFLKWVRGVDPDTLIRATLSMTDTLGFQDPSELLQKRQLSFTEVHDQAKRIAECENDRFLILEQELRAFYPFPVQDELIISACANLLSILWTSGCPQPDCCQGH